MSNIQNALVRYFMDITRIELRHLRYFVAVAEELHFGRAAMRLGIAQPPLSQQIQHLEAYLGTRLLDRTRRKVALTDAGRALLGDARRLLGDVERAIEAAQRAGRGESGSITVAFAASVMFLELPAILRAFRERYPGVALELREMPTGAQLAALAVGEIDVGFLRQPAETPGLSLESVTREPLHMAVNRNHPLAARRRIALRQLANEPWVLFPREAGPGLYAQILGLCHDAGFTPRVVQETRELYTTVSLVEAGVGVTIVPASVERMGWTGVRFAPVVGAMTRIAMGWRPERAEARPVVHAFVKLASDAARAPRPARKIRSRARAGS